MIRADMAGRCQPVACGADITVVFLVEDEVSPRECSVIALTLVPQRDMRRDLLAMITVQPSMRPRTVGSSLQVPDPALGHQKSLDFLSESLKVVGFLGPCRYGFHDSGQSYYYGHYSRA